MKLSVPNALALHPLIYFSIIRPCWFYIALLFSVSLLLRLMSFSSTFLYLIGSDAFGGFVAARYTYFGSLEHKERCSKKSFTVVRT